MTLPKGINIDEPRFPQTTYINRAKHFLFVTNPLVRLKVFPNFPARKIYWFFPQNVFASEESLNRAARIVKDYKAGKPIPDVKTEEELWQAKYLYDSAFHPDTGGLHNIFLRPSGSYQLMTLFCFRKNDLDRPNERASPDEYEYVDWTVESYFVTKQ